MTADVRGQIDSHPNKLPLFKARLKASGEHSRDRLLKDIVIASYQL